MSDEELKVALRGARNEREHEELEEERTRRRYVERLGWFAGAQCARGGGGRGRR
jgi:hypothetical protein